MVSGRSGLRLTIGGFCFGVGLQKQRAPERKPIPDQFCLADCKPFEEVNRNGRRR